MSMNIEALCAAPPEALAHGPSQMPLSCPDAPPSQRELRRDGGGGDGGVARRARAARAPKAKSCAMSCGKSFATSCVASFTCPSLLCHLRAGAGGAPRVRVAARRRLPFFPVKGCFRRVFYVLAFHVLTATATGPAAPTMGFERSASPWRDDEGTTDEEPLGGGGVGGSWRQATGVNIWRRRWWWWRWWW